MPLFTADALVLRTYKLAEADRIVVFLTCDRGKKRGVAPAARRPRSRFNGALEPLTQARIAYFERERRELVNLNYADAVQSPLAAPGPESLGYSHYFAELIDAWAADSDPDERLFRLGCAALDALAHGAPVEPLARYFECWLLRLQGVYPTDLALSPAARAFVERTREVGPTHLAALGVHDEVLAELERKHQAVIREHLEKELKSVRVMNDLRRFPRL
ncbi:MAG: DNA repair protein RecO [Acidobacteriota bacterium]